MFVRVSKEFDLDVGDVIRARGPDGEPFNIVVQQIDLVEKTITVRHEESGEERTATIDEFLINTWMLMDGEYELVVAVIKPPVPSPQMLN